MSAPTSISISTSTSTPSSPSTSSSDSSLSDYGYGRGADVANEGYKGHLSSAQKEIYDQFRAAMPGIEEKAKADHLAAHPEDAGKFDKPAAYQVGPDHKEYTALRFLRARKFDLKAATEMYTKHMAWRYLHDVDHILCPDTRVPKADLVAKLVPHVMHGWDKSGRPVFFEKPGKVEVKTVTALVSEKEYLLNHIAKMENHLRVATEQAAKTGRHCETFTLVLDLTGVKLAASNTGYLAQCSENDTNNYPECLGQLIIINAPWIFPVFWKLASPFVDKRTKSKITIVYGKYEETLRSIMDEDQIPACYGGKCTAHKDQTGGCLPETDLKELKLSDVAGDVNEDAELKEITVAAGKRYEEKHELKKGASVHWYFRLENADVSFSVTFHAADAKPETVLAPVRTHTHQGSHRATTDGHVIILFDNHHSYFKSKTVRYSVMLMEPNADAPVPEGTQETPRIHDEE